MVLQENQHHPACGAVALTFKGADRTDATERGSEGETCLSESFIHPPRMMEPAVPLLALRRCSVPAVCAHRCVLMQRGGRASAGVSPPPPSLRPPLAPDPPLQWFITDRCRAKKRDRLPESDCRPRERAEAAKSCATLLCTLLATFNRISES